MPVNGTLDRRFLAQGPYLVLVLSCPALADRRVPSGVQNVPTGPGVAPAVDQ